MATDLKTLKEMVDEATHLVTTGACEEHDCVHPEDVIEIARRYAEKAVQRVTAERDEAIELLLRAGTMIADAEVCRRAQARADWQRSELLAIRKLDAEIKKMEQRGTRTDTGAE